MNKLIQCVQTSLAAVLVVSSWAASSVVGQDAADLTEKDFREALTLVELPTDKPWRKIPWKISLLDAQNEAAKAKKPIFIWAMDGHPLGCT